MIIFHDKIK